MVADISKNLALLIVSSGTCQATPRSPIRVVVKLIHDHIPERRIRPFTQSVVR